MTVEPDKKVFSVKNMLGWRENWLTFFIGHWSNFL